MPQGIFIKRHKILKSREVDGKEIYYGWEDMVIGTEFDIYGRVFRVVDCDDFTRKYYEEHTGLAMSEPEFLEDDTFSSRTDKGRYVEGEFYGVKRSELKSFVEASLGKFAHDGEALGRFLDHDRQVLRFYCKWDNREALYGDIMSYELHYFLAEDKLEIREVHSPNSGRDVFPIFLKKGKLPKNWHNDRGIGSRGAGSSYYTEKDLQVGKVNMMYTPIHFSSNFPIYLICFSENFCFWSRPCYC